MRKCNKNTQRHHEQEKDMPQALYFASATQ